MKRFNEAAGIHRRKLHHHSRIGPPFDASMRPPEFTGGNAGRTNHALHHLQRVVLQ